MRAKFDVENDDPVTDDADNSYDGSKEKKNARRQIPSMIMTNNDLHPFIGF